MSLRLRFLLAFLLVAIGPVTVLATLAQRRMARAYDDSARQRLNTALEVTRARLGQLRARIEAQTASVAGVELPTAPAGAEGRVALEDLGARHELPVLEVLDHAGHLLASRHWAAGVGLPDDDVSFGSGPFRLEKAVSGFASARRLALVAERTSLRDGRPVLVRGGLFLDRDLALDLARTAECRLGFFDAARGEWTAPSDSPFLGWRPAATASGAVGEASLAGRRWMFAAAGLAPALFLVAALPQDDLDRVFGDVRGDTAAATLFALVLAVAAALALAQRLSRPIRELSAGIERIARGELGAAVGRSGTDELGALARSFDAMTEDLHASRERLVQAERVAAWREMARRLAHELKNPIFPIQVSLDTLGRALDRDPQGFAELFRASSVTIRQELQALRRIVDEFSAFARMPRPQPRPTALNAVAAHALELHRSRAAGIQIECTLEKGLPPVWADPDLLGRAVSNLVANALEAMPAGGTLRLRTARVGGDVKLEVEDTGPGLTEEQRTRLFAPYFTTKQGGTGLGLAIVQGIVSDHGGRVEARSEPGKGTSFSLTLPCPREAAAG